MRRPDLMHEFFTPEQLKRAWEQRRRRPEMAPVVGEQIPFSLKFNPVTKTEHEQRLKNGIKKKGVPQ